MVMCELCNKGYHTTCIYHPLDQIPADGWTCENHSVTSFITKVVGDIWRLIACLRTTITYGHMKSADFKTCVVTIMLWCTIKIHLSELIDAFTTDSNRGFPSQIYKHLMVGGLYFHEKIILNVRRYPRKF